MYGIDIISTVHSINTMMDLYERGIISEKETGGVSLKWGDVNACIERILEHKESIERLVHVCETESNFNVTVGSQSHRLINLHFQTRTLRRGGFEKKWVRKVKV